MSEAINYIKNQVTRENRNFTGIFVGRTGSGKSWSTLKVAVECDPDFTIDHVVFKVEDLLNLVHDGNLKPGTAIVFDEAGVAISNRQSYMNKFNKSISFLLQTWRNMRLILLVTVPDIAFVDAGVRKLFDAVIECEKVVKSRNVVKADWKFIQVNAQSGKAYFHNLKNSKFEQLSVEIGKPDVKLIHLYEKKKREFQEKLYKELSTVSVDIREKHNKNIDSIRTCKECGHLGRWNITEQVFKCQTCGFAWKREVHTIIPSNV